MANVKNAPEGIYFTEHGYSQCYPWIVKKVSPSGKTITLARVETKNDPEWKPNFIPGGFCAHCDNQHQQTWLFDSICPMRTRTIRLNKKGQWVHKDVIFTEAPKGPYYFYDYNF